MAISYLYYTAPGELLISAEMANIDKKLAKKLAKMPEEERQAFLENLRLQEEENQRKKEEMLLRFLKVRLSIAR